MVGESSVSIWLLLSLSLSPLLNALVVVDGEGGGGVCGVSAVFGVVDFGKVDKSSVGSVGSGGGGGSASGSAVATLLVSDCESLVLVGVEFVVVAKKTSQAATRYLAKDQEPFIPMEMHESSERVTTKGVNRPSRAEDECGNDTLWCFATEHGGCRRFPTLCAWRRRDSV